MKYEKIIKREDGSRVRITISLRIEWNMDETCWDFMAHHCAKNKRTWTTPVNHDDYQWRKMDAADRKAEDRRRCLTLVSPDEVYEAMLELWEQAMPRKEDLFE